MFRSGLILLFAAALTPPLVPLPQKDVNAILGDSERLYYQARFRESLDLLTALDGRVDTAPDNLDKKVRLKLQLALSYLGLDEIKKAKTSLVEMCVLAPNCSLDADEYSPKVLALFNEAKAEAANSDRCFTTCDALRKRLAAGDPGVAAESVLTSNADCECAPELLDDAAEQAFRRGMEAYTANDMPAAVKSFRQALQLHPKHVSSTQYLALVLDKMRLVVEQKVLEWRKNFSSGAHGAAAADYQELESLNLDGIADSALEQIRTTYRNSLSASVQGWDRACREGDAAGMERLRREAGLMLPDEAIAQDLLHQMSSCTAKPCVRMDVQSAMRRVRTTSEPEIPMALRRSLQTPMARTVQVSARIEENGDVSVLSVRGQIRAVDDAVSSAVEKWKFFPTIIENESRCVETVLPIVITPSGSN